MRLTVSSAANEVDVSFDYEGLDYLLRVLANLRTYRAPDHDHLMSEDWGGDELTLADPMLNEVVHKLTFTLVGKDGGRDEVGSTHPVYRDGRQYGDRKPKAGA